jgi:streptomycin 6-kinase
MLPLSKAFTDEVTGFRNGQGAAWLERLPGIVARCCERWALALGEPLPVGSLSYLAPATREDGTEAILKVGLLRDELVLEATALRAYDGRGAVRLLEATDEDGALLLERAVLGTPLGHDTADEDAVRVAASVMRRLFRPAPAEQRFPSVADWATDLRNLRERFAGDTGPFPGEVVDAAERALADLCASAPQTTLLHGDLHHGNILRAEREAWLAVDPKGFVGEPACEVGPFLLNGLEGVADLGALLNRRVHQFAEELSLDADRIRAWGMVRAVLAGWWSIEDSGDIWGDAVDCARLLADPWVGVSWGRGDT